MEDPCIKYIRDTQRLKSERDILKDKIKVMEAKYKEQELKTIKKGIKIFF